jgi:DNA-binding NarL/FixJ family response regulator
MTERFLIVDDHPLFRDALRNAIHLAYPQAEIRDADSIETAQDVLAGDAGFDLLLLDLSMPGTRGLEGLLSLRKRRPRLPIAIISGIEDSRVVAKALASGIAGYIPKSASKSELAAAIADVLKGLVYVPSWYVGDNGGASNSELSDGVLERLKPLTPQQLRVLEMLRRGMLNKQIAYELKVGETTVKAHVSEIFRRLNVSSRTMAAIELTKVDLESIVSDPNENKARSQSGT